MLTVGVAGSWCYAGAGVSVQRAYPAGDGCAHVPRSPGLVFQGRNRSRAGPDRGFPLLRPHSSR